MRRRVLAPVVTEGVELRKRQVARLLPCPACAGDDMAEEGVPIYAPATASPWVFSIRPDMPMTDRNTFGVLVRSSMSSSSSWVMVG